MMLSALFRDYAFLTSAYVLEPVDMEFRKTGKYTTGRNVLPRELAVPMKKLADARTRQTHPSSGLQRLTRFHRSRSFPLYGVCQCLCPTELGSQGSGGRYHLQQSQAHTSVRESRGI
jgi:hypothetical protein